MRILNNLNQLKMSSLPAPLALSIVVMVFVFHDFIPEAKAEPQMTAKEAPLEGTHVFQLRVKSNGYGNIVLSCQPYEKSHSIASDTRQLCPAWQYTHSDVVIHANQ